MIYNHPDLWRNQSDAKRITITITGTGSTNYCYVEINGVKYTSAKNITIAEGTEVSVYVGTNVSYVANTNCYVKMDGTTVHKGAGTYTFCPTSDCSIELVFKSTGYVSHGHAVITTT